MNGRKLLLLIVVTAGIVSLPVFGRADSTSSAPASQTVRGQVVKVLSQQEITVPGTNVKTTEQEITVRVLEGTFKNQDITITNDVIPVSEGEGVYVTVTPDDQGNITASGITLADAYRLPALGWLTLLFVALVFIFGGWQGIRGLGSLVGSLILILFVMLPGLLHGWPAVPTSIGVSALIIIVGSYITHGFNRTTTSAIVGMVVTVAIAGGLAWFAVHSTHLSGVSSEEALYLTSDTNGQVNLLGILLGGILIGLLGVLYDIAIGQAISVEELRRASPTMHAKELYKRATRIGREHIGALVNVLAIAYVGSALPLLLLFYSQNADFYQTLNKEIFATEIVRTLVGSMGLVIAVPITTIIAVTMLKNTTFAPGETAHSHHHH